MEVFLATPCYGSIGVNYLRSVIGLTRACDDLGIPLQFGFLQGESLVTRARNELVARFLESGADRLFWVDADVGFETKDALRLLTAPYDVVAGSYPLKGDGAGFPIDPDDLGPPDERGVRTAPYLTTGFMCVNRSVFERLMEQRPDIQYAASGKTRHRFFDTGVDPESREYLSEDYFFCDLWRSVGGQAYIDPNCLLTHEGGKTYVGRLADFLGD